MTLLSWLLSMATVVWHFRAANSTPRLWVFALILDALWVFLYAALGLYGPLAMAVAFGIAHGNNLRTLLRGKDEIPK